MLPAALFAASVVLAAAAPKPVDLTLQCTLAAFPGGLNAVDVESSPTGPPIRDADGKLRSPPPGFSPIPGIRLTTGRPPVLLELSSGATGYRLDKARCRPSRPAPALAPHRLPSIFTLGLSDRKEFLYRCPAARVLVRIRLVEDGDGIPLRARFLLERLPGGRPLVYLDWSRSRDRAYAAGACAETR